MKRKRGGSAAGGPTAAAVPTPHAEGNGASVVPAPADDTSKPSQGRKSRRGKRKPPAAKAAQDPADGAAAAVPTPHAEGNGASVVPAPADDTSKPSQGRKSRRGKRKPPAAKAAQDPADGAAAAVPTPHAEGNGASVVPAPADDTSKPSQGRKSRRGKRKPPAAKAAQDPADGAAAAVPTPHAEGNGLPVDTTSAPHIAPDQVAPNPPQARPPKKRKRKASKAAARPTGGAAAVVLTPHTEGTGPSDAAAAPSIAAKPDAPPPPPPPPPTSTSREVVAYGVTTPAALKGLQSALRAFGPLLYFVKTTKVVRAIYTQPSSAHAASLAGKIAVEGREYPVKLRVPPTEGPPSDRLTLCGVPPALRAKELAIAVVSGLGGELSRKWSRLALTDTGAAMVYFDSAEYAAKARGRLDGLRVSGPDGDTPIPISAQFQSTQSMIWMVDSHDLRQASNPLVDQWEKGKKAQKKAKIIAASKTPTTDFSAPTANMASVDRVAALKAELAEALETIWDLEGQLEELEALAS